MSLLNDDINNIGDSVSDNILDIKRDAVWQIEDVIFKTVGSKLNQDERLVLAGRIMRNCINMDMSVSDDYANMYMEVRHQVKEFLN